MFCAALHSSDVSSGGTWEQDFITVTRHNGVKKTVINIALLEQYSVYEVFSGKCKIHIDVINFLSKNLQDKTLSEPIPGKGKDYNKLLHMQNMKGRLSSRERT